MSFDCAPETSPCRTPSLQSDGIDPLRETVAGRERSGNRDPVKSCFGQRAASSQLVLGSACGQPHAGVGDWFNAFALLDVLLIGALGIHRVRGAGANPKPTGSGISTHRAKGIDRDRVSHSFAAYSSVRPGVPQLPTPGSDCSR